MTLEEARRLKLGDKVLVEATVHSQVGDFAIFRVQTDCFPFVDLARVSYDKIHERIPQPRRKFRRGDIAKIEVRPGVFELVICDGETNDGRVMVRGLPKKEWPHYTRVKLVCAAHLRDDREEVSHG